jgi:Protein of unknown function (DUF3300)
MKPQFDSYLSRSAWLSRLPLCRTLIKDPSPAAKWWWTPVLVLAVLPLAGGRLRAQEGSQPWPTDNIDNGVDNGQYQPSPQGAYGQQQYSQRPYGQSQYAQPQYGQPRQYAQLPQNAQQGYGQQAYADTNQGYLNQGLQPQGFNAERLEQMVAPIALYPDNLVAQVLAASTYPAQVAAADQWLRMQRNAAPEQIAAGADGQTNWDPSIKALTAFPQVLEEMARNLAWTTDLGNAYYNQPQDVMQTIQVMRDRAQAAGNLQSTPQEQVTLDQGNIELTPTDSQQVYVPSYNPWGVYGQPVQPYQGFSLLDSLGSIFGSSPIQYGLSFAMSAFMHTPWGWLGWGLDWLSHSVLFNHDSYFSRSNSVSDWGFPHGGQRAYSGRPEMGRYRDSNGWGHGGGYPQPRPEFNLSQERTYGRQGGWYGNGRTSEGFGRGYQSRGDSYRHSWQEANNHMPRAIGRPQEFNGNSSARGYGSYGSGAYGRSYGNYNGRSGTGFSNPANRALTPIYHGGESGGRAYGGYGYGGSNVAQSRSGGGFHLFGGHQSNEFNNGGGHSSKGYSYGGGHSSWGGGFKAPKASHFGGGGGHFGGGHGGGGGGHSGGHGKHH